MKGNYRSVHLGQYLFAIFHFIAMGPCLFVFSTNLVCYANNPFSQNFECFSRIHILYFCLALVGMIWCLFCLLYIYFFTLNLNPFSSGMFSCSSNLWVLGKFITKLASVVFILADPELKYDVLYLVSLSGINLANFAAIKMMWPLYWFNPTIDNFVTRCIVLVITVTGFFIPLLFFYDQDPNNILFISSWVLGLLLGQFFVTFFHQQKKDLI